MSPLKLYVAVIVGLVLPMTSAAVYAETISSVVERVIHSNPSIGAAYFNSESRREGLAAVSSLSKPRLSLSAQAGLNDNRNSKSSSVYGGDLQVVQRLYDGGETKSQVRKAQAELNAAKGRYGDAVLVNSLLVIQTYIEVQRTRQVIEITKKNLAVLANIESIVRQRAEAGFASEADVYHAKSTVAGAREQLLAAQQQADDAESDFETMTGNRPGALESKSAPNSAVPSSADECVELALLHSPRIIALGYDALAAYASLESARSASAPKVNLNMRANYNNSSGGVDYEELGSSAQVVLKFDLYDAGEKRARQRQAALLAQETQQNTLREKMNTKRDVRRAWNNAITQSAKLSIIAERADAARQSFKLNLERFKAGKADISVLLNLQAELASSQTSYVNEQAEGRYNTYRILAATGRLFSALKLNRSTAGFKP